MVGAHWPMGQSPVLSGVNPQQDGSEFAPEPDILNYWGKGQFDIQMRHIIMQMKQVTS